MKTGKPADVKELLKSKPPKNGKFYCVAIDGRGAAGKSNLSEHLEKLLPGIFMLHGDDYFEPVDGRVVWGDFNNDRFKAEVIKPLQSSNTFIHRPFIWEEEPHIKDHPTEIKEYFCIERCYSFEFDLDWDLKIWVETPKEECFRRAFLREHMPPERVTGAWTEWQDTEDKYIARFNPVSKAGIIIDGMKPLEGQIS